MKTITSPEDLTLGARQRQEAIAALRIPDRVQQPTRVPAPEDEARRVGENARRAIGDTIGAVVDGAKDAVAPVSGFVSGLFGSDEHTPDAPAPRTPIDFQKALNTLAPPKGKAKAPTFPRIDEQGRAFDKNGAEQVVRSTSDKGTPTFTFGGGFNPAALPDAPAPTLLEQAQRTLAAQGKRLTPAQFVSLVTADSAASDASQTRQTGEQTRALGISQAIRTEEAAQEQALLPKLTDNQSKQVDLMFAEAAENPKAKSFGGHDPREFIATFIQQSLAANEQGRTAPSKAGADYLNFLRRLQQAEAPQQFALGGEVEAQVGGQVPTGPAAELDTGDFVVPAQALRFFGSKFFTDLINKAQDAED